MESTQREVVSVLLEHVFSLGLISQFTYSKAEDLVHFFNEDGLGAIVNSSRGIIAAYTKEQYAKFGEEHFAEASRQAALDMIADINGALHK